MKTIKFYHEFEEYGFLSNYYSVDILIDGIIYKSSEHYYQSQKTLDPEQERLIINAETPEEAKKRGNSPDLVRRPDWDTRKVIAMRRALEAKFTQNPELREQLLETADAVLIENSEVDYYWGIGADGSGKSMLGKLLMERRTELQK
ncbi:hypothetical protein FACS189442_1470 [Spirochaetia bacterium]|nr:hypothetical protein FACS189442_1470 [Spirochaetia bacterium]